MNDHEPSYYEIALTNRQVLIAFAILLVCLVAAFLAGVWVGRGDVPPQPVRLVEEAPPAAGEEGEEEPLSFFSGDAPAGGERGADAGGGASGAGGARGGAAEPPTGSGSGTTLAEDLGESVAAGESERPVAPQTVEPPPEATPRTETRAAPPAAESRPPAAGEVVIQVFSSHDREQAQKIAERLVEAGRDAYLSPVEMDGRTMYRVRIGPFADRAQAQPVADDVRRRFRLDTWITPR